MENNNNEKNNQFDRFQPDPQNYQPVKEAPASPVVQPQPVPQYVQPQINTSVPGRGVGIAAFCVSMAAVLFTILSIILPFSALSSNNTKAAGTLAVIAIISPLIALILSVVGLILAAVSKKQGYNGGLRGAAFGVSLSFLILDGIAFLIILSCIGCAGLIINDAKKTQESMYNDAWDRTEDMYDDTLDHVFGE